MDLWVVTIFGHTDVPKIEKYEAITATKNGWRIRQRGSVKLLRKALERKFFTDEEQLQVYVREHTERRIKWHRAMIRDLDEAKLTGVSVYEVPAQAPVYRGPIILENEETT